MYQKREWTYPPTIHSSLQKCKDAGLYTICFLEILTSTYGPGPYRIILDY